MEKYANIVLNCADFDSYNNALDILTVTQLRKLVKDYNYVFDQNTKTQYSKLNKQKLLLLIKSHFVFMHGDLHLKFTQLIPIQRLQQNKFNHEIELHTNLMKHIDDAITKNNNNNNVTRL